MMLGWLIVAGVGPAAAAECSFAPQGEGRVAEVIDARSFRLQDGREVRLAGIEPAATDARPANRGAALAALILGHEVTLQGEDDSPDRYGRQPAFVFLEGADTPVQGLLLAQGDALAIRRGDGQGLCVGADGRRNGRAAGQTGSLGRPRGHKKHRKSGRYFDQDRAVYCGRGQGSVRSASRGNDLPEFRTELDTGLCCDYSKAWAGGV